MFHAHVIRGRAQQKKTTYPNIQLEHESCLASIVTRAVFIFITVLWQVVALNNGLSLIDR